MRWSRRLSCITSAVPYHTSMHAIFFSPFKKSQGKYVFIARCSCNRQYCLDHHIELNYG